MQPRTDGPSASEVSILLVDDEPANLLALEAILEAPGRRLVRAASGEEALRLLGEGDFAVVLLDLRLPGLDGFETAKLIRGGERSRHTPVIFLTAGDGEGFPLVEAYRLGAVDYLVKPLVTEILQAKVKGFADLFREKERARRQAEQLLLLIQGTSDHAIFMLDPQGVVATWNAGAERLKGYKADEIVGRHFSVFYPPEANERGWPAEELRRAAAGGRFEDEGWRLRKDGSRFWANVVITALRDEAGRLVGFGKVTRDLTDRRQREASLRQSEEHFRLMVEGVRDYAIFMLDPQGVVTSWNAGAERLKGYAAGEVVGRHFSAFYPQEAIDRGWPQEELRRACAEGRFEDEGWRVRKDGTPFWANVVITALRGEGGRLVGYSKVTRDLTARRLAEEQARQLAAERAALAEAESAARRRNEFLAILGHELRSPMAPLRNGLQVLKLAPDEPARERAREMMERQLTQMVRLVDDLLDVSRITTGKLELRKARVELRAVIENAVETARPQIESGGHALTVTLPLEPVFLDADLTRLAQVFWNLLNNAARYSEPGGRIDLAAEVRGGEVIVSVADAGIGIPSEALPGLFEMFSQVDRSLERAQGGLGIGLSLVKGLAQMHGGSVTAHSDGPGRGSTFVVRLPLAGAVSDRQASPEMAGAPGQRRRVLVVDDNRDGAASLAMVLTLTGHEARTAHDGLEALEVAEAFRPELIVLDLGLPKLNGYDACRRIRERPWGKAVVIVAATGWGQDKDRRRSKEAGFDAHLVKPVDHAELARLLNSAGASGP